MTAPLGGNPITAGPECPSEGMRMSMLRAMSGVPPSVHCDWAVVPPLAGARAVGQQDAF